MSHLDNPLGNTIATELFPTIVCGVCGVWENILYQWQKFVFADSAFCGMLWSA